MFIERKRFFPRAVVFAGSLALPAASATAVLPVAYVRFERYSCGFVWLARIVRCRTPAAYQQSGSLTAKMLWRLENVRWVSAVVAQCRLLA